MNSACDAPVIVIVFHLFQMKPRTHAQIELWHATLGPNKDSAKRDPTSCSSNV